MKRIWIAWETQRRSVVLAEKLGCKLFIVELKGIFRYPVSILKTLYILAKERPEFLFVQNPSMILSSLACMFGMATNTTIVVDRHTTFRLNKPHSGSLNIWLFMRLHYFTLKWADLTIVTNDFLAEIVNENGGDGFVLPDMIPHLEMGCKKKLKGKTNLFLISSFGLDEPICEVLQAMDHFIEKEVYLYISGNDKKIDNHGIRTIPSNVILTGFLSDLDFTDMLFSCDIAMALTTSDYCMLCGCYEAVAAEKPLITSDKSVLKEYFKEAVFVDNDEHSIVSGIQKTVNNLDIYINKTKKMKNDISILWNKYYKELEITLKKNI